MNPEPLSSALSVGRGRAGRVGADRIALMEAIDADGSIMAAAKRLGMSYRAAWDAVQAVNNLFDEPLVQAAVGGAKGGAAIVTERGHRLISAYRRMEAKITQAWLELEADGAALWSL